MRAATEWAQRVRERHEAAVAAGKHDAECEYHVDGFYLCHCSKRRREAAGETGEMGELYFPPPDCPRCDGDLEFDGDGWTCEHCCFHWKSDGTPYDYTDDYGDGLAEESARWAAHRAKKEMPAP